MIVARRKALAAMAGAVLAVCGSTRGGALFTDSFSIGSTYVGAPAPGISSGAYTATDGGALQGTWTAAGGTLTYSRPITGNDPNYNYESSVLLTNGSTCSTGSTAGLAEFTITTTLNNIPAVNTAQPGLIVSGSLGSGPGTGGYLLEDDNGQNSHLVLLEETGNELLGDEESDGPGTGQVVGDCGSLTVGDSYSISLTESRPSNADGHTNFSATIVDLGPNNEITSSVYAFADVFNSGTFGGTQVGFRVRDPLDADTPSFGPLSLSLPSPEPNFPGSFFAAMLAFISRRISRGRRPKTPSGFFYCFAAASVARIKSDVASESRK